VSLYFLLLLNFVGEAKSFASRLIFLDDNIIPHNACALEIALNDSSPVNNIAGLCAYGGYIASTYANCRLTYSLNERRKNDVLN
jgi:hypothetical protein